MRRWWKEAKKSGPRRLVVIALAAFLVWFGGSTPANAQTFFCSNCSTFANQITQDANTAAQWVKEAAQWAWEQAQAIIDDGILSAGNASNVAAQLATTNGIITGSQGIADGDRQGIYAESTRQIVMAKTRTQGNNMCATSSGTNARMGLGDGVNSLAGALADATRWARTGSDTPAQATEMKAECDASLRDSAPTGRYGALLQKMGCAPPAFPNYVDADFKPDTVVRPTQYTIPPSITINATTGQIQLPTAAAAGATGMDWLAAVYTCRRFRQQLTQPPSSTSRAPTERDLDAIEQGLDQAATSASTDDSCLRELVKRTAVPQAVAGMSAQFQNMYNQQVQRCKSMFDRNIIDAPTWAACQSGGMSALAGDRAIACRMGSTQHVVYLAGTNTDTAALTAEQSKGEQNCQSFDEQQELQNAQISQNMRAARSAREATAEVTAGQKGVAP